jgi:uncharacterized protein YndB with AHSA1/START domain
MTEKEGRLSFELRLERSYTAPPEEVFDLFVDPDAQAALHGSGRPGWVVHRSATDARVGGTSTYVMGADGEEPDTETRVHTAVDRPDRLTFTHSMEIAGGARTVVTEMTITFEGQDGTTLVTMVQTGFERQEDRDGFLEGWSEFLETLGRQLKARHDTEP